MDLDLPSFYGASEGKGRDALEDVRALIQEAKKQNLNMWAKKLGQPSKNKNA